MVLGRPNTSRRTARHVDRHPRRVDRRPRRGIAAAAGVGLLAASVFTGTAPAAADPTDVSESLARFLGGDVVLGEVDLDTLAELAGANAEYPSGAALERNPLSVAVLEAIEVDLTGSLSLLGDNGLVELGAVNQYAAADADGATAASGAVDDDGAIEAGGGGAYPADASLDLVGLVPDDLQDSTVSALSLELGALSATAEDTRTTAPVGDYQVAGADLAFTSPLVADVYAELEDALVPVQDGLDSLGDSLSTAVSPLLALDETGASGVTVTVPDLTEALPTTPVGAGTAVVVDLETGAVTVDLETLLATDPDLPDLNDLPANYELLDGDVVAAISDAVVATVAAAADDVVDGVEAAVSATTLDLDLAIPDALDLSLDADLGEIADGTAEGLVDVTVLDEDALEPLLTPLGLTVDTLAGGVVDLLAAPVGATFTLVDTLEGDLDDVTGGLADTLDPVLDVLTGVLSVTGNVQVTPGDLPAQAVTGTPSFTQRALSVRLLSLGTGTELATVNLASATVRVLDAPAITADPATVPASGTSTVTGTGFTPGGDVTVTLADDDGDAVSGPLTVTAADDGTITVDVPVAADTTPDDYTVTAVDPVTGTATTTLTVTAAPTVTVTPGTVPAGGTVEATGTGFTPGAAAVQLTDADGDPVGDPVPATIAGDGTLPATDVPVPADATAGPYTVVVTDSADATGAAPLAVTPAPTLTADPAALLPGDSTTVDGAGFTPDADVTVQLTDPDGTAVGAPETVPTDGDGTFAAPVAFDGDAEPGTWTVVATDPTGAAAEAAVSVVDPAITATPGTVPASGTTTVDGTGFTAGGAVTVVLQDDGGADVTDALTVTAAADGTITVELAVPGETPPDDYTILATDTTLDVGATAPLTVTAAPDVTVSPATVPAGGTVEVTGTGFTPGAATVQLTDADGDPVGAGVPATVAGDGTLPATDLTVPADAEPGPTTVVVTDSVGASGSAPLTVTAAPAVVVTPGTVAAGGTTTATGEDFTPDADVTVQLTDSDGTAVGAPITVATDGDGALTTPVTVPAAAEPGTWTVAATDPSGATASDTLVVTAPAVTADPATVPAGGTTTVDGDGFTPGETVTVEVVDGAGDPVAGPVTGTVDPDGTFTVDVPVPAGTTPGDYDVVATDGAGGTAETPLAVTPAPTVTADPSSVPAGGTTTVTGDDFTPDAPVTVRLLDPDGDAVGDAVTVDAGPDGTVTADLAVPDDAAAGAYVVEATDSSGATATAPLEVTPAPVVTVSPGTVAAGDDTTVAGDDFTPGGPVTVQLTDPDGDAVGDPVAVTTDPDGGLTTPLTVPDDAAAGAFSVAVADPATGVTVVAPLRVVSPSATVDPGTVPAGGTTTVEGDGFAPDQDVTIVVTAPDGDAVVTATVPADGDGSVSSDVPVPADTVPGDHTVAVVDETTGASVEAPLTVTPAPTIEVTGPTVEPGDEVDVDGDGFTPGAEVVVDLRDDDGALVADPVTALADEGGVLSAAFLVPEELGAGQYAVVATDVSDAQATASLTVVGATAAGGTGADGSGAAGALARTGPEGTAGLLASALALLTLGALAVRGARATRSGCG